MARFTDNPIEYMMAQVPKSGPLSGERPSPFSPEHPCNGCPYGRDKPCVGTCLKEMMKKQEESHP